MREDEVIIFDGVSEEEFKLIVEDSLSYAIISLPFTVNRMSIEYIDLRILNTAKGKIAEKLFNKFCEENNLELITDVCITPFYQVDLRDFILNNIEWDIKNNFIYHANDELQDISYTDLPALIPNRYTGDQWTKRTLKTHRTTRGVNFLFTFLKGADLKNNVRGKPFLSYEISDKQKDYLKQLCKEYNGKPLNSEPYTEESFWNIFKNLSTSKFKYNIEFIPKLIICGYASLEQFDLFYDTENKNFCSNTIYTKIKNKTCIMNKLPSFKSYANLDQLVKARYKR